MTQKNYQELPAIEKRMEGTIAFDVAVWIDQKLWKLSEEVLYCGLYPIGKDPGGSKTLCYCTARLLKDW